MLQPYKYIHHDMEKIQGFVDYIFYSVWMEAEDSEETFLERFEEGEHKKLISHLYDSNSETSDKFCKIAEDIYKLISVMDISHRDKLKEYYEINSNIEALCEDTTISPITYTKLEAEFGAGLKTKIKEFNDLLYGSGSIIGLKEILEISDFNKHYDEFIEENGERCLFCGLIKLEILDGYKSDYDHFLPKAQYPFLSINLGNLAPSCERCNQKFKKIKNPLYKEDRVSRRKAIYPFSLEPYEFSVDIKLINIIDTKGKIEDSNLDMKLLVRSEEETDTWDHLYKIYDRYKGVCSSKDEADKWIKDVKIIMEEYGVSFDKYIKTEKKRVRGSSPYHEALFLKIPFLEACKEANII